MNNVKRLAILGASPSSEVKLKNLVENALRQDIEWGSASDNSIEGIIINSNFLSSDQVQQKYIRQQQKTIVCYYRNTDKDKILALAKQHNIIALNIDDPTLPELTVWLSTIANTHITVDVPSIRGIFTGESNNAPNTNNPTQPNTPDNKNTSENLSPNYTELLSYIQNGTGGCTVYYKENQTALLNLDKKEVYLNFNQSSISGIDSSSWQKSNAIPTPANSTQLKLDTWLFETIWQSNIDCTNKIDKSNRFKIKRWPQPFNPNNRSKALFLAACIQKSKLGAQQLQQKTGFIDIVVCRFLYAALQAGLISVVAQGEQQTNTGIVHNQQMKQNIAKIGLLAKLRSKLGIA